MMSIKAVKSASNALQYYRDKDNYYLSDRDGLDSQSHWHGKGAKELGLQGEVGSKDFLDVLCGQLPGGQAIRHVNHGEISHRPGIDVTFSPSKSVSLLILIGGDNALLQAHHQAVKFTLGRIERDLAEARTRNGGMTAYEKTKNLVMALFPHSTSRELDPQIHTHAVILNATQRENGAWRALASRDPKDKKNWDKGFHEGLLRDQHYYGLLYTATMAEKATALGYDIRVKDQHGNFEIKGISEKVLDHFSKRSDQIKEKLMEKNMTGAHAAEIAALDSRKLKTAVDNNELNSYWDTQIKAMGCDLTGIVKRTQDQRVKAEMDRQGPPTRSPKDSPVMPEEGAPMVENTLPTPERQPSIVPPTIPDKVVEPAAKDEPLSMPDHALPPQPEPEPMALEATREAISHLSLFNVKLRHTDLVRQAFRFSPQGESASLDGIESAIASLVDNKMLMGESGHYYTTAESIATEKSLIDKAKSLKGVAWSCPKQSANIAGTLLHKPDRVQIVESSGVKAERAQLTDLVNACDNAKRSVQVLHMGRLQCNQLAREIKRPGGNIWAFLRQIVKPELVQTVSQYRHHIENMPVPIFGRRSPEVIIVADAQKLSLDDLNALMDLAKIDDSKLLLSHNTDGLDGYSAGNPIALLKQAGITTCSENRRFQKAEMDLRTASDPTQAAVLAYLEQGASERQATQVIASTRKQQTSMNDQIRSTLLREGELSHEAIDLPVLDGRTLTRPEQRLLQSYHVGDRLTFKAYQSDQKHYRVVDKKTGKLILENSEGKRSEFLLKNQESFIVSKAAPLTVCVGEQLFFPKGYFSDSLKLDLGVAGKVLKIDPDVLHLQVGGQRHQLAKTELREQVVAYNYVRRPSEIPTSPKRVITALNSYQINKQQMAEIASASEKMTVFTDDLEKARSHCDKNQVRWLAFEVAAKKPPMTRAHMSYSDQGIMHDLKAVATQLSDLDPDKLAQTAVSYAMAKLGEREAGYKHTELMKAALKYAIGNVTFEKIETAIKEKETRGELLHAQTYWVTPESIALEKDIVKRADRGIDQFPAISKVDRLTGLPDFLTKDQRSAINLIVKSRDQIVGVQGFAGSGKTTMMKCVKSIAAAEGYTLQGLAPTHEAVERLQSEAGFPAMTAHRFLLDKGEFSEKILFIIDECSMMGSRVFNEVQKRLEGLKAKAVFCGDIAQNPAVESGKPQAILMKLSQVKFATMREIVRQRDNLPLKETAYLAAAARVGDSIKTLSKINPSETVRWIDKSYQEKMTSSVIEVDCRVNEDKKKDYSKVYDTTADMYLSRVIDDQKRTIVVAHAHEDRYQIDDRVREGLKEQEQIKGGDTALPCLTSRNLDRVDLLFAKSYETGDIIRCDKAYGAFRRGDYLSVRKIDVDNNTLTCQHEGLDKVFELNPAKNALKANFSVYEFDEKPVAIGERLRLRRTDPKKGWQANREYEVTKLRDGKIYCQGDNGAMVISPQERSESHWEYAYTSTSYGVQGNDDRFVLGLELVKRKNATTWKDHYVTLTRGQQGCMLITDDKAGLMRRLDSEESRHHANKLSALELYDKDMDKTSPPSAEKPPSSKTQAPSTSMPPKVRLDAKRIEPLLKQSIDRLAITLLGEPNRRLSTATQWRYGNKGSLAINRQTGGFVNFEEGTKGNVFSLIKEAIGIQDFKEVLQFGADFLNYSPELPTSKPQTSKSHEKTQKVSTGMIDKAQKIMKGVKSIKGTLAEKYLTQHRLVDLPAAADLAYHPGVYTKLSDGSHSKAPALIAFANDKQGELKHIEIHRLDPKTGGKHQTAKIQRQSYGAKAGIPISLNTTSTSTTRYIVEGVVTGLSLLTAKPDASVDAYLGKGNFANIKVDAQATHIVLCVDNDGSATYIKSMVELCERLERAGKKVTLMIPDQVGHDLNDVLKNGGKAALEKLLSHQQSPSQYKLTVDAMSASKILKQKKTMLKSLHDKLKQKPSDRVQPDLQNTRLPSSPQGDIKHQQKVYQSFMKERQNIQQPVILPEQVREK